MFNFTTVFLRVIGSSAIPRVYDYEGVSGEMELMRVENGGFLPFSTIAMWYA